MNPVSQNPALSDWIVEQISQRPNQRITFAEYMNWVLYHPQHGYYTSDRTRIGATGDFVTSPYLATDFGELLAEQFVEMWRLLDYPKPFTLVEMGAGQGLLVADIVRYLHRHYFECFEVLNYLVVEQSPSLIAEQRQRLQPLSDRGQLQWCTWEQIPSHSIIGCCFSNELVDAFPVHQVAIASGTLQEVYVTVDADGQFTEALGELSTPELAEYFKLVGVELPSPAYPEGYRTEVNLAARDWLATVSDRLQTGYLLTIDYGYLASRYYSPSRSQGTLQCYYQHRYHNDPYRHVGLQDLTAHVDFTALQRWGAQQGLQTLGFTQQGLFLMALGLGDRIAALSNPQPEQTLQDILHRREALHALMNPMGMGNFGVLVQGKGVGNTEQGRSLKGLSMPPLQTG